MSEVLVVHCVDTEGPLGGDARRLPDGRPEFFNSWEQIVASLEELTAERFRRDAADSFGEPYRFSWFILDFTGFATNPKRRVDRYHDTYDHLKALPTELDGLYWHYHAPPASGIGDRWAESWLESNEHNTILARRLLEREDFPEAFRAGGTIEDEAASAWLEEVFAIDISNRVSERSRPDDDLYSFTWHGAPDEWGAYHPSHLDVRRSGAMRRYVYRSIDLRSRYNELTQEHVDDCFRRVAHDGRPRVLSYFSHDNRDMRPETHHVVELLRRAEERTGVRWRSCTAVDAHWRYQGLEPGLVDLSLRVDHDTIVIATDRPPFQAAPFTAAELSDGRFVRLYPTSVGPTTWRLRVDPARLRRIGAAVTSETGQKTLRLSGS